MTNTIHLDAVSGAIIPYTPPKTAEEFVDGEVVKKAHEIFEKAIHFNLNHSITFHLQECKYLKVPHDDLLKWRHVTNTNPIQSTDHFFSILKNKKLLLSLFSFLDRNILQNLSQCDLQGDVDQYVDETFERCFGISLKSFQESANKYSLDELSKLLNKAIKNNAPEIVFEKFLSILFPEKEKISRVKFEEVLYVSLFEAIKNHAPTDTILSFLNAAARFGKICHEENPTNLLELALEKEVDSKKIIEALLNTGAKPDTGPVETMYLAVEYGASAAVIEALLNAKAKVEVVHINDAIDYNASAEVIRLLLDAGVHLDVTRTFQGGDVLSIHRALRNGASFEIIKMLLVAGAIIRNDTVDIAQKIGASEEVIQFLKEAYQNKMNGEIESFIKHLHQGSESI